MSQKKRKALAPESRRDKRGEPEKRPPARDGRDKKKSKDRTPSQRQLRVAEEIRHVLAGIFARREFRDPELAEADITVSEVRLSPDMKHATAFISRLGRMDVEALLPALKRVTPWLRGQVAKGLPLRFTPDLNFLPDQALDYATKINRLMQQPEVVRDLTHWKVTSGLSFDETRLLETASNYLSRELATVEGISTEDAYARIRSQIEVTVV